MIVSDKKLNTLFADVTEVSTTTAGNSLDKTAQLTNLSQQIANDVIHSLDVESDAELIKRSQESHDAMDSLIADKYELQEAGIEFLNEEDDDVLERMLKSQQSKRSRTKSKTMTIDNYRTLMTAGVAENLLRLALGKEKQRGAGRRGSIGYSAEELEVLANNEEELRKAIRNVQSKKSIMKSKADFDAQSERYQELLATERQLKAIRDASDAQAALITQQLQEQLSDVDPDSLSEDELREYLANFKKALATR